MGGGKQVGLVSYHYGHQVTVLTVAHLLIELLHLDERMRVGEVVYIQNSIEKSQFSLLDVLCHAISTGVPHCQIDQEVVVDANLLEAQLKSIGRRDLLRKLLLLPQAIVTSMQFSSEDLPTSLTPTSAIFTFS